MPHNNCIFCKIIAREIPSEIIIETDSIIVIKDIYPKASIHYLIIPKKHISDIQSLSRSDTTIPADILYTAQQLSTQIPGAQSFRLVSNNGTSAGQVIFHIHIHFLAGQRIPEF